MFCKRSNLIAQQSLHETIVPEETGLILIFCISNNYLNNGRIMQINLESTYYDSENPIISYQ